MVLLRDGAGVKDVKCLAEAPSYAMLKDNIDKFLEPSSRGSGRVKGFFAQVGLQPMASR
jgi:hypothetical protein